PSGRRCAATGWKTSIRRCRSCASAWTNSNRQPTSSPPNPRTAPPARRAKPSVRRARRRLPPTPRKRPPDRDEPTRRPARNHPRSRNLRLLPALTPGHPVPDAAGVDPGTGRVLRLPRREHLVLRRRAETPGPGELVVLTGDDDPQRLPQLLGQRLVRPRGRGGLSARPAHRRQRRRGGEPVGLLPPAPRRRVHAVRPHRGQLRDHLADRV